jgi:poly(hydroxyalkanoate) granule-associated protein
MAKKPKREASNKQFADQVAESANQIWLAGLAAFDKAQKEGWKLFESLVEDGEKVEAKTRKLAEERIEAVKRNASGTWDKLEQVFEDRVARALHRLGVPTNKDIQALAKRVETLNESVQKLAGGATKARRTPSARRAAGNSGRKSKSASAS